MRTILIAVLLIASISTLSAQDSLVVINRNVVEARIETLRKQMDEIGQRHQEILSKISRGIEPHNLIEQLTAIKETREAFVELTGVMNGMVAVLNDPQFRASTKDKK